MRSTALLAILALTLAGCGGSDPAAEEAAALNNAAEMLDASADSLAAPDNEDEATDDNDAALETADEEG